MAVAQPLASFTRSTVQCTHGTTLKKFAFKSHVIDTDLSPKNFYGQTALADMDGDGRPEFVMGERDGNIYVYKYQGRDRWTRHVVGSNSPGVVELTAVDVDRDGKLDLVVGGVWYRNSGDLSKPFERLVYDPAFNDVHDVFTADIDGDGNLEVVAMSDRHDLRGIAFRPILGSLGGTRASPRACMPARPRAI